MYSLTYLLLVSEPPITLHENVLILCIKESDQRNPVVCLILQYVSWNFFTYVCSSAFSSFSNVKAIRGKIMLGSGDCFFESNKAINKPLVQKLSVV